MSSQRLVNTEPPPLDELPGHVSVEITTDTDDEISKLENSDLESVESELEESDEISDAEGTDTDAPEEVND